MWNKNILIDNSAGTTLADCIRYHLLSPECRELCIATGYWDIPGMALLHTEFENFFARGGKLRMIIGEEPVARQYQIVPERVEAIRRFPDDYIKLDIDDLKDEYKPVIKLLMQYCADEDSVIQIRVYGQNVTPKQFLHAKCYIFRGSNSVGIIGSANFTHRGLVDNTELSYLETNSTIVGARPNADSTFKGHIGWFEEKWEQSVPWEHIFKKEILEPSPLGRKVKSESFSLTPYAVYIKYLQGIFGVEAETSENCFIPDIPDFKRLEYQIDAVNRGFSIMREHNGFILADVVGLGKTVVAMLLANKFFNSPDIDGRSKDILIVTPPAVKEAWEKTIALFDQNSDGRLKNHITIITTGKVVGFTEFNDEQPDDPENDDNDILVLDKKQYGLILIDESHKFRNSETQMYKAMDDLIDQIYPQPYIVLLSATPQNNSPKDLKNQIFLFQREPQNTTLETIDGRKLDTYFSNKQKEFLNAKKNKDYQAIKALSADIRQRVLDQLLVRRTRTDIRTHYNSDTTDLHFPEISGPHSLKYALNSKLSELFFDTMNLIAPTDPHSGEFIFDEMGLTYERYRAIEYLTSPEDRKRYQVRNLTPEGTSRRLAKIMQILLVKRLESSFAAFRASLINLKRYTQNMVDMLNDDCVFICPDIDVNAELDQEKKNTTRRQCYEDLRKLIARKGGNNYEYKASAFSPAYRENLTEDLRKITNLCDRWSKVGGFDPKLQVFLNELEHRLFNSEINNPHQFDTQKLIIFTEAIDTVELLKDSLENAGYRVLAITAANRDALSKTIAENFDANVPPEEQKDDFNVLITTEVLAEGVNLHRANVILNYDTPWNSTRLMQRIGRVNRIGSKEDFVHVFNFMPTAEGDQQIELINKAHSKLQAFHALFGEDSQIFTTMEEVSSYGTDPEALRTLVEGELSPLEPYAAELRKFQQDQPEFYKWIAQQPSGIGCARGGDSSKFCCVVKHPSRHHGLNLILEGDATRDVHCLEMLEHLKCSPDTAATALPEEDIENFRFRAIAKYSEFMQKMMTAGDGNKKRTAALKAIREIKQNASLNEDTKALLNLADSLIRKNDRALIRRILNLHRDLDGNSLPGLELGEKDINQILHEELQALARRRNVDNPQPEIALYMADKEN